MSKTAGVALAVVAVLAGLAIGAIPAQSQPGQRTTITVLDLDSDDRFMGVDNNRKGDSAGDAFGLRLLLSFSLHLFFGALLSPNCSPLSTFSLLWRLSSLFLSARLILLLLEPLVCPLR